MYQLPKTNIKVKKKTINKTKEYVVIVITIT